MPLQHALVRDGARGHRPVHAHVDQAPPGGGRVAVLVREPVLPGVAVAVRLGDVVGVVTWSVVPPVMNVIGTWNATTPAPGEPPPSR